MCAALRSRHRIAIGTAETFAVGRPSHSPFDFALIVGQIGYAAEQVFGQRVAVFKRGGQIIRQDRRGNAKRLQRAFCHRL